jgi:HEAT repeat protein
MFQSFLHDLSSADPSIRAWAAISLGKLNDQRAVLALIDTLVRDDDPDVRFEAYMALGALRDPRAIPAMFILLNEPQEEPNTLLYRVLMPMRATAIAHLLSALTDAAPTVRIAYSHNLVHHCFMLLHRVTMHKGDDAIIEDETEAVIRTLLAASGDNCAEVRSAALGALASFDDVHAREALLASLRDADPCVR